MREAGDGLAAAHARRARPSRHQARQHPARPRSRARRRLRARATSRGTARARRRTWRPRCTTVRRDARDQFSFGVTFRERCMAARIPRGSPAVDRDARPIRCRRARFPSHARRSSRALHRPAARPLHRHRSGRARGRRDDGRAARSAQRRQHRVRRRRRTGASRRHWNDDVRAAVRCRVRAVRRGAAQTIVELDAIARAVAVELRQRVPRGADAGARRRARCAA